MGRVNVYLPDDIEQTMRTMGLKPSELLQEAILEAADDDDRRRALDGYIQELYEEVGSPTDEEMAEVDALLAPARAHKTRLDAEAKTARAS